MLVRISIIVAGTVATATAEDTSNYLYSSKRITNLVK